MCPPSSDWQTVLTVASIPAAHPYVVSVVDTARVTLLPDPTPPGATEPGQWWPPRLLDPAYLRHQLDEIDVVHVHFGFDAIPPDQLVDVVDLLTEHDVPLVVTVHDLENPHFTDQSAHEERLGVLLPAATKVVTLTDGAADEIARRWGRQALVLPHPHVLPLDAIGAPRATRNHNVIGIHAKNLRANVDPWPLVEALIDCRDAGTIVRLDLDDEVLRSPRAGEATAQQLDRFRRAGVDVRMHGRFTDREMVDYLSEVDVLVLPYRHGTHSGWIEACHDAGVQAAVPDCGYFHRQHLDPVFGYGAGRFDADGFHAAVSEAVRLSRGASAADGRRRAARVEQRRRVRDATTQLYRRALTRARDRDPMAGAASPGQDTKRL